MKEELIAEDLELFKTEVEGVLTNVGVYIDNLECLNPSWQTNKVVCDFKQNKDFKDDLRISSGSHKVKLLFKNKGFIEF